MDMALDSIAVGPFDIRATSAVYPEEYDVFLRGRQVAFVRVGRWWLRVDVPEYGGTTITWRELDEADASHDGPRSPERLEMLGEIADSILLYYASTGDSLFRA